MDVNEEFEGGEFEEDIHSEIDPHDFRMPEELIERWSGLIHNLVNKIIIPNADPDTI